MFLRHLLAGLYFLFYPAPMLAAGPLEEGVIIPAATQLLRYFYLLLEFHLCSPCRSPVRMQESLVVVLHVDFCHFEVKISQHLPDF